MADEDHGSAPVSRRIWLVRHGQTEANAEQRFCGWGESALTREGMEQARWLASYLSKRPLCALYSSDLRRALATAGAIAEAQQLPLAVRAMAAWREVDFGAWEGLTYAEIAARFPDRLDFFTAPAHYAPPGGESLTHLQQRVLTGLAHVLAECARVQFGAERVRFLPAGLQYRKERPHSPASVRLAMLRLAIEGNAAFAIDERELRREGPTYTVDTLEALHADGERELVLLLGADALADLPRWRSPERILALATLAVAPRPGREEAPPATEVPFTPVEMPGLGISSTLIRARVAAGRSIRYLVPEAVRAYIERERLYREG